MEALKRVLALAAAAVLLAAATAASPRGTALCGIGIASAVLVQLRRGGALRKRVVFVGALAGAAVAAATLAGPQMFSARFDAPPSAVEQRAMDDALKKLPPRLREVVDAPSKPIDISEPERRVSDFVAKVIALEMLAATAGAYVAAAVCLGLYAAFGQRWKRGAAALADTDASVAAMPSA